jgi:hypothetical protein
MLQSNLLTSLPSRVLDSAVLPVQVNLLLQMDDSVGQPVGFHTNSNQATLLQEVNLVGQGRDMGEFERSRFFTP